MTGKYRARHGTVDAHQLTLDFPFSDIPAWLRAAYDRGKKKKGVNSVYFVRGNLYADSSGDVRRVELYDWIVRNHDGVLWHCAPHIFVLLYGPVDRGRA